ncbi:MAG: fatty acid desaturase [Deltaproteobacteria bacterium]|nr:fatty acid desaturase [Deltaproteobacteria bacterium]
MPKSDRSDGDAHFEFDRTRDGDLHAALKKEGYRLPKELLQRSKAQILLSGARPFGYIAAAIGLASAGLAWPLVILAALPLFLAAQRAFLTLVHDASHKLYSEDRATNDLLADFFAAGFIGMLLRKYRKIHLAHHAANGSADDPEYFGYEVVTRAGGMARFILRYALGFEILYLLRKYHVGQDEYLGAKRIRKGSVDDVRRFEKLSIVTSQLALLAAMWAGGCLYLYPVWAYVAMSWSPLLSRLRFLAEHPGHGQLTKSTRGTWWELVYFAPYHFNFHLEHHLWPSLPPYRLPEAHDSLLRSGFFERNPSFLANSFVETLGEYPSGKA